MLAKGQKIGTMRFSITPTRPARKVALAGDFNKWKPTPMKKGKNGAFVAVVALKPGTYEYKFLVDDEWVVDSDNPAWAMNPYGTFNSVATVD